MYEKLYALWALFGVRIVQAVIPIPLWPFTGLAVPHYYQGFTYYDTEYRVNWKISFTFGLQIFKTVK